MIIQAISSLCTPTSVIVFLFISTGLAALSQRHVAQSKRALSLKDDLRKLSIKAGRREDELAATLREGRTAGGYVADMQVTFFTCRPIAVPILIQTWRHETNTTCPASISKYMVR